MLKVITMEPKAQVQSLVPWRMTEEPYKAYRAESSRGTVTLNITPDFDEEAPCKIIKTAKGHILLINCVEDQDQQIGLVTVSSGVRGLLNIKFYNCEVYLGRYNGGEVPSHQFVVRFFDSSSKILVKTGDRNNINLQDITCITYDSVINDNYMNLDFEYPANGCVIDGARFSFLDSNQRECLRELIVCAREMGYGVYVGIKVYTWKVLPRVKFFKDKQQVNSVTFEDDDFKPVKDSAVKFLKLYDHVSLEGSAESDNSSVPVEDVTPSE